MALIATILALVSPSAETPDPPAYDAKHEGCRTIACDRRMDRRIARHRRWKRRQFVKPYRAWLLSVRTCESGGNYATNTGNGFYGAYQFVLGTWRAVGGAGYPHQASRLEQDYRAVVLLRGSGTSPWPVCG